MIVAYNNGKNVAREIEPVPLYLNQQADHADQGNNWKAPTVSYMKREESPVQVRQ